MAASPGKDITDNDELSTRAARGPFTERHRSQGIGGVGLEALGLATTLLSRPLGALRGELQAVDEGHSSFWREGSCETDHAEGVAPVAEMPGAQLPPVQVGYIGIGLAVLARLVAKLRQVRAASHLDQ